MPNQGLVLNKDLLTSMNEFVWHLPAPVRDSFAHAHVEACVLVQDAVVSRGAVHVDVGWSKGRQEPWNMSAVIFGLRTLRLPAHVRFIGDRLFCRWKIERTDCSSVIHTSYKKWLIFTYADFP